jgi:hypothetical protein
LRSELLEALPLFSDEIEATRQRKELSKSTKETGFGIIESGKGRGEEMFAGLFMVRRTLYFSHD